MLSKVTVTNYSKGMSRYIPEKNTEVLINSKYAYEWRNGETSPEGEFKYKIRPFRTDDRPFWIEVDDIDVLESDANADPTAINRTVPLLVYEDDDTSKTPIEQAEVMSNVTLIAPYGTDNSMVYVDQGGFRLEKYLCKYTPSEMYYIINGDYSTYGWGVDYGFGVIGDTYTE